MGPDAEDWIELAQMADEAKRLEASEDCARLNAAGRAPDVHAVPCRLNQ